MTDITERLRELSKARWDKDAWERETTVRIPAEPDRDIDLVLSNAAAEIARLRARVAELEAADGECFTGQLVEIDGHIYGLRPGAARIVKEAMRDAVRYRWLRQPNALERAAHIAVLTHNGGYVATEDRADAAIDAAMAKDGA